MTPLVSIAMPSFNQAQYIEAAIESVFSQSYARIELVVSDGASTDGTVEVLEACSLRYAGLRWTSEPDRGPSDAIIKSFNQARGEVVGWLNSDDLYAEGAVAAVVEAYQQNPDWLMCYGRGDHVDEDGRTISPYPTLPPSAGLRGFAGGSFICQPTVFLKTSALTMLGDLDRDLKTAFDYDYWIRAFRSFPERIGFLDRTLAKSRLHAECITNKMRATVALEGLELSHRHLGVAQPHWVSTFLEELRTDCASDGQAFADQARAFLDRAAPYLNPADLQQMRWAAEQAAAS